MRSLASTLGTPVDKNGNDVTPVVAADRIVSLFRQSRVIRGGPDGTLKPLGVMVSANVEIVGLQGRSILLSWTVLERSGASSLPETWQTNTLGYRLQATSDKDTGTLDFWVPLPKASGKYFVRLTLSTDGAPLTSEDSPDFG